MERLLQPLDYHPQLFVYYQYVLNELREGRDVELALRTFEQHLLQQLGFQFDVKDCQSEAFYLYDPTRGFILITQVNEKLRSHCFSGEQILGIVGEQYQRPEIRRAAKRLMRLALEQQLGNKPLRSRELLQSYNHQKV